MCGVFGISGHPEAAHLSYLGLHALQHRGQESAGIVSRASDGMRLHRAMGLVSDCFDAELLTSLEGSAAIGHVRYSTAGSSHLRNAQPLKVTWSGGELAVAHNGNLTNARTLRGELEAEGAIFQTDADTEVLIHLIARSRKETLEARLREALGRVEGAYSLVLLTQDSLIAVRDARGFRPLWLGRLNDSYVVASETVALDLIEAEPIREIAPGELLSISEAGLRSEQLPPADRETRCVFESIYFARPDARVDDETIYERRRRLGARLARERPVDADVVIAVPDSGTPAAIGFAREANLPYDVGLIRSHYVGRTFIEPQQSIRHFGVRLKLSAIRSSLEGRRVVVVDDSIVRGTTSRKIVAMVRAAGASEVHLRISAPPTRWPCYYGIDTPSRAELIASSHDEAEIARYVGADSLAYLSLEGLGEVVKDPGLTRRCAACFTGDYPTELELPKGVRPAPPGTVA